MFKSNGFIFSPAASTLSFYEWEGNCRNSESEGVDGRQSQVGPAFAKLGSPLGAKHTHRSLFTPSSNWRIISRSRAPLRLRVATAAPVPHSRVACMMMASPGDVLLRPLRACRPTPLSKWIYVTVAGCISPLSPSHTELPQIFNLGLGIAT